MSEDNKKIVYYNMSIDSDTSYYKPITKIETRSEPILENPENYKMSIVRFTIPTNSIPIAIFPHTTSPLAPDNTAYKITLTHKASSTDFTENVVFIPRTDLLSSNIHYYYIYSYEYFIALINTAFSASFLALKTAFPGIASTVAPFLTFDCETELFTLHYDDDMLPAVDDIGIYMNTRLYLNFDSFETYKRNDATYVNKEFEIILADRILNHETYGGVAYLYAKQESKTLSLINGINSILIVSGTLPIESESITIASQGGTQRSSLKIVSDFIPNYDSIIRGVIQYLPTAEYRRMKLNSSTPLSQIHISVFWRTRDGSVYPIQLFPYSTEANIKFMFEEH